MRFVCPRVIRGNRGDLTSRYAILSALHKNGITDVTVHCEKEEHILGLPYGTVPYGYLYNLVPSYRGLLSLIQSRVVLWTAGLDLQDDSSLVKLLHTLLVFGSYRLLGLRVCAVAQGAGPLTTSWGQTLSRFILRLLDRFMVRDPESHKLLASLTNKQKFLLGYDGIFLGDFEFTEIRPGEQEALNNLTKVNGEQPIVGFNIRQWFHFRSSILPYQFAKRKYSARGKEKMADLITASVRLLSSFRLKLNARVLLVSAYEPGLEPWEDDLGWLRDIKLHFQSDGDVLLVEQDLSIAAYWALVAKLDLMIGARLHSTLTALRLGVPAINISYTLKGKHIFEYLNLRDQVVDIESFIKYPSRVFDRALQIIQDPTTRSRISSLVESVVDANERILLELLKDYMES